MSIQDDLDKIEARKPRTTHPKGWAPGHTWDGTKGEGVLTTPGLIEEPEDWDELLAELEVPLNLMVDLNAPMQFTSWDGWTRVGDGPAVPAKQTSFRARLVRRSFGTFEYDKLAKIIQSRKPQKAEPPSGEKWLIVPLADFQTGKRAGNGLEGLTERVQQSEANLVQWIKTLRKIDVDLGGIAFVGMGDIVEGCGNSHYSYQGSDVVADRRDQIRTSVDLIYSMVDRVSPMFEKVVLTAVAGNHGENRQDGKAVTNPRKDNDDLLVFDWLGDKLSANPDRYGHVQVKIPEDQLATSFDFGGTIVGFTHGHQFDRGGAARPPVAKAAQWREGQQMGRTAVSDADVLVFAHFHHPLVTEHSVGRWIVQCPTIDGGSTYFEASTGRAASPGIATFVTGSDTYVDFWRVL